MFAATWVHNILEREFQHVRFEAVVCMLARTAPTIGT
jgi:hypothetical protein